MSICATGTQQGNSASLAAGEIPFQCGTSIGLAIDSDVIQVAASPAFHSLSLRVGTTVDVRGSCSAKSGYVELFSEGRWKGIADISTGGTFANIDVPFNYLNSGRILARIVSGGALSAEVWADPDFVHSRSVLISPTARAGVDKAFYSWRLHWSDWQPTGYKLQADQTYSVWVEGDDENLTALIGVRGLARSDDRTQRAEDLTEVPLRNGFNQVRTHRSGVLHIRHCGKSPCLIVIPGGAAPIPFFRLGSTYHDDFKKMLAKRDASSEVQLVGDRLTITAYKDTFEMFAPANLDEIVKAHEDVLTIEASAAGLTGETALHTRSNLWIHAVECASTDSPHAGTGYIGLPSSRQTSSSFMKALVGGEARNQWVTLHEYGHHFQNTTNTVAPWFDENSVNIYSLAVGRLHRNDYSDVFPRRWEALRAWLSLPRGQKTYNQSPDMHAIFEQLRKGFGDTYLPRWDRYAREQPVAASSIANLTLSLSKVAERNLAEFFADWGVIRVNDEVWQSLQALGLPPAPGNLTSMVPYT